VAALLVDAGAGVTAQDQHIAGHIHDRGRGAIIVVNKWDEVAKDSYTAFQVEREVRARLKFLEYAPVVFISALTGQRATRVLRLARQIRDTRQASVRTADLNRFVADVSARHNPPSKRGRALKIFYATQIGQAPPAFAFFVNDRRLVHFTYERYVENQLRMRWPFEGTPVRLVFRQRDEKIARRRERGRASAPDRPD
jgi:GTP-binding protein